MSAENKNWQSKGVEEVSSFKDLLTKGVVHVWKINFREHILKLVDFSNLLSMAEKKRVSEYRLNHIRDRYIITHGLSRLIMGRYLGQDPKETYSGFTG